MTQQRFEKLPLTNFPRYLYEYYVTGSGDFPIDMLRFDQCWPADGEEAAKLGDLSRRSIRFQSHREPTVARWSSFVWSVSAEKF